MPSQQYFKLLIASILLSLVIHFSIGIFLPIEAYLNLTFGAIVFFGLLATLVYFLGERALRLKTKNGFFSIVLINVFLKLIGSFVVVLIYVKLFEPEDRLFLIPFLLIYLVFMIFETYFLMLQAKQSKA